MSQYDKHTLHCVLSSVSSNSHKSMSPTSRIICFDSGLKGLNDWRCCRSRWKACRFGWFSIFWINSRTPALCACFTIKCGSPGIFEVHVCLNSFTNCLIVHVERFGLMIYFRVVLYCNYVFTRLPWSIMSLLNIETLAVFRWTCLNTDHVLRDARLHWSIWRTEFFVKRIHTDLLRTGRFSFILNNYHVLRDTRSPWSITNWIWNWLGWLEEICLSSNFSFWLSSNFPFWLSINFRTQFLCPIVTWLDLWWRSRWHVWFFHIRLLQFSI